MRFTRSQKFDKMITLRPHLAVGSSSGIRSDFDCPTGGQTVLDFSCTLRGPLDEVFLLGS